MNVLQTESLVSFKNILYPTDFSPFAEAALPFVCDIARIFHSRVTAVHVRAPDSDVLIPPLSFPLEAESTTNLAQKLRGTLDEKLKTLEHELLIGDGEVWDFMFKLIQDREIDLIVMGTQGKTGLEKFILGSVAELIFRQANCPVLTVGPHVVCGRRRGWEMYNILLATDFTPESLAACPLAFSLARERRARLTLLNVLEPPEAEDLIDPQRYIDSTVRMLQNQVPAEVTKDCYVAYEVAEGPPSAEILRVAKMKASDLIVLGVRSASGRLGLATHLARPTAHQVVSNATCPVLTVRG